MKLRLLGLILLLYMLLTSCSRLPCTEYMKQPVGNIAGIELIYNQTGETREVLYTLAEEQLTEFITKLSELTIGEHREPHGSLGYMVVGLIYKDGSIQMLGTQSSMYIPAQNGEEIQLDSWHYIRYSEVYELFSQYVDDQVLSSLEVR